MEENHYPTDNFESLAELARTELDEGQRPAMRTELENLEDYDVIFVGYPIWWYDMPAVMYTFFDQYDFSGKTIIPFTTHGGDDRGTGARGAGIRSGADHFAERCGRCCL